MIKSLLFLDTIDGERINPANVLFDRIDRLTK